MRIFFGLLLLSAAIRAAPPPVPSAGIIERQLEKEYEVEPLDSRKQIPQLQIEIPDEHLTLTEGKSILIKSVEIEGNEVVLTNEILSWLHKEMGKEMNMRGIYALCQIIDKGYALKGYFLARAYPPPQTIKDGVLRIAILEGRLGSVRVEGNQFYSTTFIEKYFTRYRGKALAYQDFMRALLLLNENTDLMAGAVFEKGKEVGQADLVVHVQDRRPLHLYLNANNYGRYLTTNSRVGGRFDWGNVLVNGDTFSLAEVVGFPVNALYFTDVKYKIPVTSNGAFMEADFLYSNFDVEQQKSLRQHGNSMIGTLKGSYAIKRTKPLNLDFSSYFDVKQFENYTLGSLTSSDKLRVWTTALLVDHFDQWGGRDYFLTRMALGIPSFLGGMAVNAPDSSRPGAGGRFIKFNIDYDRLQQLWNRALLKFHASGQWSPNLLTVPEQIYIGGSDTVRGFPLAVGTGDRGYYGNLELHISPPILDKIRFFSSKKDWGEVVQLVGFLDQGGTFYQSFQNTFLLGAGFGLRVQGPFNLGLSVDIGYPLNRKDLSTNSFMYIKITGQPF